MYKQTATAGDFIIKHCEDLQSYFVFHKNGRDMDEGFSKLESAIAWCLNHSLPKTA